MNGHGGARKGAGRPVKTGGYEVGEPLADNFSERREIANIRRATIALGRAIAQLQARMAV